MTCIIISTDISTGDGSILDSLFRESSSQTDIKLHPVIRLSKTKYPSQEALQWARAANKKSKLSSDMDRHGWTVHFEFGGRESCWSISVHVFKVKQMSI